MGTGSRLKAGNAAADAPAAASSSTTYAVRASGLRVGCELASVTYVTLRVTLASPLFEVVAPGTEPIK